jgi:hypothetical protein
MATLAAALALAPSACLVRAPLTMTDSQDLDGECAVAVHTGVTLVGAPHRCSNLLDVAAFLASGAVPGVHGDERDWEPV